MRLREILLGRLWQYLNDPKRTFVVMSAYTMATAKTNPERSDELKSLILDMGYGFVEQDGGWTYGTGEQGAEISLIVAGMSERVALDLARSFDQEAILSKRLDGTLVSVGTDGSVLSVLGKNLEYNPEKIKDGWSRLRKHSHRHKKFAFPRLSDLPEPGAIKECGRRLAARLLG